MFGFIAIIKLQGLTLTSVGLEWPLTSTEKNRILLLNKMNPQNSFKAHDPSFTSDITVCWMTFDLQRY